MTPGWLYSCLGRLCLAERKKFAEFGWEDSIATKIGRNDVWQVRERGIEKRSFFVKFWPSNVYFQRELIGHQIMGELSASFPWIMAVEVLERNKVFGFIVTTMMKGTLLRELFKRGYRKDYFLSGRRKCREEVAGGLEKVLDLIQCVQKVEISYSREFFFDYSVPVVVERINRRLEEFKTLSQDGRGGALPRKIEVMSPNVDGPSKIVFGDVSFGNIFYDGSKIGIIDFEDLGMGPTFRDFLWIQYNLEEAQKNFFYKECSSLLSLVHNKMSNSFFQVIYRLDFALLVLVFLEKKYVVNPLYKTIFENSKRRRAYDDVLSFLREGVEKGVIYPRKDH